MLCVCLSFSLIKLVNSLANFNQLYQKGRVLKDINCFQVLPELGRQENTDPMVRQRLQPGHF